MSMVALVWVLGCAATRGEPVTVVPDLSHPSVRQDAQLDVLAGLVENGLYDPALTVAEELRKQGVADIRLDLLEASAMEQRGQKLEALEILERVVKQHPRTGAAWARAGILYADLGRVEEALNALGRAAKLEPRDADIWNNLGFVAYAAGKYEVAVEHYREALERSPSDGRIRNNLGFALARLDEDTDALNAFRAAGDEADARYNLGVACELRHDRAAALTNYQAAIRARPDHPLAQTALNALLAVETP